MTDEKLNELIEETSKNTLDYSVRNALMELRGLRAVITHNKFFVYVRKDESKIVIR